jgi:tetratricopeptide (TPR) repeat protein
MPPKGGAVVGIQSVRAAIAATVVVLAFPGSAAWACCRNYEEFAARCRSEGGIPSPGLYCRPRQNDPSVSQANAVNEQGREAMRRKDYDQAGYYFARAYEINRQHVFLENQKLALSAKHFELGDIAFQQRKWELAVAEYQRSLTFSPDPAAESNIRLARYIQAMDNARAARDRANYDLAMVYAREARQWAGEPGKVDEWIRSLHESRAFDKGQVAFHAKRFAEAEEHYAEALRLNPQNKAAALNRALAMRRQGDEFTKAGNIEAAIAHYDRALRASMEARAAYADDPNFRNELANARENVAALLAQEARSEGDWNRITDAHQRWYNASGGDPAAQRALANAKAKHASGSAGSRERLSSSVAELDEMARRDPSDAATARDRQRTAQNLTRADRASDQMRHLLAPALNRALAIQQARAIAIADRSECFDGREPCGQRAGNGASVTAAAQPFYAKQENERMRAIHAELDSLQQKHHEMAASLHGMADPMERAVKKRELANLDQRIVEKKTAYKDEEAADTRRHGLRRRADATAQSGRAN